MNRTLIMASPQRLSFGILFTGITMSVLFYSFEATAQSQITLTKLDRDRADLVFHLAVKSRKGWVVYPPDTGSVEIEIENPDDSLKLSWAVKKYPRSKAQIVFARTSYTRNQPISLARNKVELRGGPLRPFLAVLRWSKKRVLLKGDKKPEKELWSRYVYSQDPQGDYRRYHRGAPPRIDESQAFTTLHLWHMTSTWDTNVPTYDFLCRVAATLGPNAQASAERLIRVKPKRPKLSWIPFDSHPPQREEELNILLVYSGTLDLVSAVRVYRFSFRPR